MSTRAHRERRRRVGRKTWGPDKQRQIRRQGKALERSWPSIEWEITTPLTGEGLGAAFANFVEAVRVTAEVIAEAGRAAGQVLIIGFLGEEPPPMTIGPDGELWPDAHEMRFSDHPSETGSSRDRLDDWLARSEAVLEDSEP